MAVKTKKVSNFLGGKGILGTGKIASNDSGLVSHEHPGMGFYYGRAHRNAVGKLRDDTMGYRPVSRKQLGTPPTSVV